MGNYIVIALLILLIAAIVRYLIREWKAGHSFCGGDCKHCGHCDGIREASTSQSGCSGNCASCQGCSAKK